MMMMMGPEAAVMPSLQIKVLKDDSVCVNLTLSHAHWNMTRLFVHLSVRPVRGVIEKQDYIDTSCILRRKKKASSTLFSSFKTRIGQEQKQHKDGRAASRVIVCHQSIAAAASERRGFPLHTHTQTRVKEYNNCVYYRSTIG